LGVRIGALLACWAMLDLAALGGQDGGPPSAPGPAAGAAGTAWPREVIILRGAEDAEGFWKKLASPDYILTRPAPAEGRPAGAAAQDGGAVVDAVHVAGKVDGDRARLALTLDCTLGQEGPVWAPLRIDTPIVQSAREGDRQVQLRQLVDGRWEARLEGARPHRLIVEVTVPVRAEAERRALELKIPPAPTTSFELVLPRRAYDVDSGPGESVQPRAGGGEEGVRVEASLAPRDALVVSWSEPGEAGERAAPALSAQVEMAVDVDAELVTVRSAWAIACTRGVARGLRVRLEDDEVVTGVQVNEQFAASGIDSSEGENLLMIPLAEPMRAGESRRLVLETRRPWSSSRPLEFSGYPLAGAVEQSGFLGATHGPNLFLGVTRSQGLRRIDPRDLPTALKARPGTTLALQFTAQPFGLTLGVEEAPPLYRAQTSAELTLDADAVRNETTLEVRRVRGTLFEVEVEVPDDLKVVAVGPPDLVESAAPPPPETPGAAGAPGGRTLKVRLAPQARDRATFALKLSGRQPAPEPGEVRLGLFAPRGAVSAMTEVVVRAGREMGLEAVDPSLVAETRPGPAEGADAPALHLRTGRTPSSLLVRLERRPMTVRRETRVVATVSDRTVEVRQETTLRIRHGSLASLDVSVPEGVSTRWEASDDKGPLRVEELEDARSGARRARLHFDRPLVDAATLTFQFRVASGGPLGVEPASLSVPRIEPDVGAPGPCVVELGAAPEVSIVSVDPAWAEIRDAGRPVGRGPRSFRLARDDQAGALGFEARVAERVPLPATVASRAFIRSTLEAEGDLRVRAWFAVDSHPGTLSLALPAGARWLRARADGRTLDRIEAGEGDGSGRVELPPESDGKPVLLDVEYLLPAAQVRSPWLPPALLDGAEVLQTYWLVLVPWSRAVAGQPRGWADENEWRWDVYAWKRRPVASPGRLIAWAAGPSAPAAAVEDASDVDESTHGYLFSRAGAPSPLGPWVVSRAWAVLACSALALVAGLGLSFSRAVPWILGAGAALALSAAAFTPPGAIAFAVQSAGPGAVLGLAAYFVRRRLVAACRSPAKSRTSVGSNVVVPDTSRRSVLGVGSDDSTAIRARTPSTMDYLTPPGGHDPEATLGPRRERGFGTE